MTQEVEGTEPELVSGQILTSCSFTHLAERQVVSITGLESGQEKGKAVNREGTTNCADKILVKEHRFEESPEGSIPRPFSPSLSLVSPGPSSAFVKSPVPQAVCLGTLIASPVEPCILVTHSVSNMPETVDTSRTAAAAAGLIPLVSISPLALPIPRGPDHCPFHRYSHVPWLHLLRIQEQQRKSAHARRPPRTLATHRSLTVL